ncbi:hypothetical protein BR93DRAFT_965018 [Coniochaeta sp. PMI_546]|nr:hypothetical protein BR93DRAFT_965018 [Coniochaeta sp. PMI_546]
MDFSSMTGKWSSRSKEQDAARVRENQRRHRARTKAHIADLERKLSETQACLDHALMHNLRLISELEKLRASFTKTCETSDAEDATAGQMAMPSAGIRSHGSSSSPLSTSPNHENPLPLLRLRPSDLADMSPHLSSGDQEADALPSCALSAESDVSIALSASKSLEHNPSHARSLPPSASWSTRPITLATAFAQGEDDIAMLQTDCLHLPPPRLGESTIPCRTAYRIIKEQNYDGADLSAIRGFLAPGFRGATVQEDGCRVDSTRVFSILDLINP